MQDDQNGLIFLKDVANLLGADELDISSALYLTLEGGVRVTLSLDSDVVGGVLLYADIGEMPNDGDFLREMAQANFLGAGTDDAILALRPDEPTVSIFKRITFTNLSPQAFLPVLDAFCQVATRWHLRLQASAA